MHKATENRDAYLSTLVAKAHQTSVKMELARQRKFQTEMDGKIKTPAHPLFRYMFHKVDLFSLLWFYVLLHVLLSIQPGSS